MKFEGKVGICSRASRLPDNPNADIGRSEILSQATERDEGEERGGEVEGFSNF